MAFQAEEEYLLKRIFHYKRHLGLRFERKQMTDQ